MNKYSLPAGIVLGAFSWWVVSLLSDRFEPFDSSAGFYTGQAALCIGAFYFGYRSGFYSVLLYLLGVHMGGNLYAYLFGSGDQKAYIFLGLITTLALLVFPAIAGSLGKFTGYLVKKRKRIESPE